MMPHQQKYTNEMKQPIWEIKTKNCIDTAGQHKGGGEKLLAYSLSPFLTVVLAFQESNVFNFNQIYRKNIKYLWYIISSSDR
jgi:hypothetical protein